MAVTVPAAIREPAARVRHAALEMRAVPPAALRERVHGSPALRTFLSFGRRCSMELNVGLARSGVDVDADIDVLDFGVGCARALRWLHEAHPGWRLVGTDVDAEAIAWCRTRFPGVRFEVNSHRPPLPLQDASFDAIYALSVFTHLDENDQFAWLEELQRVARPGAGVALTVHPEEALLPVAGDAARQLAASGFAFLTDEGARDLGHPDWYGRSAHTPAYVREHFANYFEVLDYLPRAVNARQDLVLLRRRDDR